MPGESDPMAKVAAVLSAAAAILVAFNTWQVSQFDTDLRQVESERELNFRIYQSIAEAVESGKSERIRAVRVLVDALAAEKLKEGFLSALETGDVQIFEVDQALPLSADRSSAAARNEWGDWDYDVFWCSPSGAAAEAQADALVAAIQKEGAKGRIRSRLLPDSIRQTDPYSSENQYEIRYEATEEQQAKLVGDLAERTIRGSHFDLLEIEPEKSTPWYVSVFICPQRQAVRASRSS